MMFTTQRCTACCNIRLQYKVGCGMGRRGRRCSDPLLTAYCILYASQTGHLGAPLCLSVHMEQRY
jgi:hypothetical protein